MPPKTSKNKVVAGTGTKRGVTGTTTIAAVKRQQQNSSGNVVSSTRSTSYDETLPASSMADTVDLTSIRFDLDNQKDVSLSELMDVNDADKAVIVVYTKASTPGCTKQTQAFSDGVSELRKLKCVVVGASLDSADAQSKFAKNLNFNLAVKPKDLLEALNCLDGADGKPQKAVRSVVAVDKTGAIVYEKHRVKAEGCFEDFVSFLEGGNTNASRGGDVEELPTAAITMNAKKPRGKAKGKAKAKARGRSATRMDDGEADVDRSLDEDDDSAVESQPDEKASPVKAPQLKKTRARAKPAVSKSKEDEKKDDKVVQKGTQQKRSNQATRKTSGRSATKK